MSEGPIKREREAFGKRDRVSTTDKARVCMRGPAPKGYCGRGSAKTLAAVWADVTCEDCRAAGRADGLPIPDKRPRRAA